MMDVEELERALLAGARKNLAPSASDRMRVQSRLVSNPAWFQAAPGKGSVLRAFVRSWRGGLTLGFAVGALLGFGASRGLSAALSGSTHPAPSAPVALAAGPGPSAPSAPESTSVAQAEALSADALTADALVEPAPERPTLRGRKDGTTGRGAARVSAAEDSGSTLAQELALLQRARRALNRNDAQLALGIVQSLDERFPDGVLMEERVATRILSLCQLERRDEAREQGQRFLSLHPRSVYAERVRHSCAGER
jgi:hypothetical protein